MFEPNTIRSMQSVLCKIILFTARTWNNYISHQQVVGSARCLIMAKAYRELSVEIGSDMKAMLQPEEDRGTQMSNAGKFVSAVKTRTSSYRYSRAASVTGRDHIRK